MMCIYLDFDGCMHRVGREKMMFEHLKAIEAILREHPFVGVVISSSLGEEHSFDEMRSYFSADVQHQIVDATPILPGATRHAEVIARVQDTSYAGDYIVIDDDPGEFPG